MKSCESSELVMRWQTASGTRSLNGEKVKEVKDRLVCIIENEKKMKANSTCPSSSDDDLHTTIDLTIHSNLDEKSPQSKD